MRMIVGHLESQVRPTDERALRLIGSYPGRPLVVTAVRAQHDPASGVLQWDTCTLPTVRRSRRHDQHHP